MKQNSSFRTFLEDASALNEASGYSASWPPIIFVAETKRTRDPASILSRLPRPSLIVLRSYDDPGRPELAIDLAERCRNEGHILLIGGDIALAQRVRAAGLHLPERRLADLERARRSWPQAILSAAVHSRPAAGRAAAAGADILIAGTVFESPSHAAGTLLGIDGLRAIVDAVDLPVYAIGGIDPSTIGGLRDTGIAGVAGIGVFGGA